MNIYCIFDDFDQKSIAILQNAGGNLTLHPTGVPRPNEKQMKAILETYDGVIIGTSQIITENMFDNINSSKMIATASVGLDHIRIPDHKKSLITVFNAPKANAESVAEYTIGSALFCCKRYAEGNILYKQGKNNKCLYQKPEDLYDKKIGVIGAGNISVKIMEYASLFGMDVLCWTRNPNNHFELSKKGIKFLDLCELIETSDYISVNLPNTDGTKGLISEELVDKMKETCVFISVSRKDTINIESLFEKARKNRSFYVCLDLDVDKQILDLVPNQPNVLVTPHIAGGTIEARKRMFYEVAEQIAEFINHN